MTTLNTRNAIQSSPTDGAVKRVAITGSAQTLDVTARGVAIKTAGNIVGKLLEESADITETFEVGDYARCFKSITSATATGFLLL